VPQQVVHDWQVVAERFAACRAGYDHNVLALPRSAPRRGLVRVQPGDAVRAQVFGEARVQILGEIGVAPGTRLQRVPGRDVARYARLFAPPVQQIG
jgi:hypothetical protein